MAAAATGIFNHAMTAGQALAGKAASPMAATSGTGNTTSTDASDDSSSNSATISANDFLTLLVTEMQNQDPTADTDPNEYINQLVQVNSLEQLIDINQTLSGDVTGATAQSGSSPSAEADGTPSNPAAANATDTAQKSGPFATVSSGFAARNATTHTSPVNIASGNLSVPQANAAAQRVGHALDGRTHARQVSGNLAAAQ
jgi:flagellar basal-body rod modification protein FlgD